MEGDGGVEGAGALGRRPCARVSLAELDLRSTSSALTRPAGRGGSSAPAGGVRGDRELWLRRCRRSHLGDQAAAVAAEGQPHPGTRAAPPRGRPSPGGGRGRARASPPGQRSPGLCAPRWGPALRPSRPRGPRDLCAPRWGPALPPPPSPWSSGSVCAAVGSRSAPLVSSWSTQGSVRSRVPVPLEAPVLPAGAPDPLFLARSRAPPSTCAR